MNTFNAIVAALTFFAFALLSPLEPAASEEPGGELSEELERQMSEIDVSPWDEYTEALRPFTGVDYDDLDGLLLKISENGLASSSSDLLGRLWSLLKERLKDSWKMIALLTVYALITSLSGIVSDEEIGKTLGMMLCAAAVTSITGLLASLLTTAREAVVKTGQLSEKTMPIMSALMVSIGAENTAGVFTPQFVFLSGTVIKVIEKAVLPLAAARGVVSAADAIAGEAKLGGLLKLLKKLVRWILGILSTVYAGSAAIQGMTAASRDGVAVRTAKYALDKLVPIAGGIVNGTADSIMGCALLLRNGIGTAAVLILISVISGPLIVLLLGMLVFRAAEAVCSPLADERAVRLLSNAADTASDLFACAAVSGAMYALTILVIMASGGIAAGLW